jgi:hypothetical protein
MTNRTTEAEASTIGDHADDTRDDHSIVSTRESVLSIDFDGHPVGYWATLSVAITSATLFAGTWLT